MRRARKTEIRVSKSGRKYWYNPDAYKLEKERTARLLGEQPVPLITYDGARTIVYCHDRKSDAYMRYYDKKCLLRSQYPGWKQMSREQWLEYMSKIITMLYTDEDYHQYVVENKTAFEQLMDDRWEELKQKEQDYDGRQDEY